MSRMCVKFIALVVLYCYLQEFTNARPDSHKNDPENKKDGDIAFPDDLTVGPANLMHHHHHGPDFYHHHNHGSDFYHHHSPEFHRNHNHNHPDNGPDPEVEFKELDRSGGFDNSSIHQIPLDYIKDLNQYNVSDLLLHFVEGQEDEGGILIEDRFGEDGVIQEKSAATLPKGADCVPELQVVRIANSDDPSVLYIPQCTRIERCGGCCKHDLLSCQPLKKESISFKVLKTQYTGAKKLKVLGYEPVMLERHIKCKCLCKVQKEDCTKFQEYIDAECRCACKNYDEKKKCVRNNATKLWNPDLCTCQCRENMECSTGSYFDQTECRCMAQSITRRATSFQRRSYRSELLPVMPLDDEEYY